MATSPGIARSPRRRGSKFATTVARPATWPVTVTMPTSRSATPAAASDTFRKAVRKSSATGTFKGLTCRNIVPCNILACLTVSFDPGRCGEIGHVAVQCSKASEVNCYNCGKSGHVAKECTIEATA